MGLGKVRMEQKPVTARIIIEMLGKPKEHIESTLAKYINQLKKEGKLNILKEECFPAEEKGDMFSCFTELEIKFADVLKLVEFCFDAMPSSIDIIEPAELAFDTKALTDLLNDLQARLHQVDMAMKSLQAEKIILDSNAVMVFNNFARFILKDGDKKIEELSKATGVKPEQLKLFLDELIKQKKIVQKGDVYSLLK